MLEARFLGTFAILYDGNPVVIPSRIAQSLFAYLILTAGIHHRREKLAGMFWPDATEEKARTYLRHELWRIRKTLSAASKVDYLIADDINISFRASSDFWLDAATLKNLNESAPVDVLMSALSEYQGELLPGFYEEWITQEREYLHSVYDQNMSRLLQLLENEKRWQEILEWAERWISFGNTTEAGFRYLMKTYEALGDRTKVRSTYERCVQALKELDLEPSEETRALAFKRTSRLNIPIPLTSFIGREKELNEVANLFSKSRLVTLSGSGGVGKTRLAIQVVADVLDRFPDGVWFLDLAPLSDSTLIPNTLANVLGLRESAELPIAELLINYFRSRTALIIFDNCEHLIESCAQLVNLLLTSCENLSILATSRESLRVSGEIPYRVPSLEITKPDVKCSPDELLNIESVKLFTDRATLISSSFEINSQNALIIAEICQRLEGIPLAIELAAARVRGLSVQQISLRLDDRFQLLTRISRVSLPRQQTLRATIDWSYNLLLPQEKILLRRLAVFAGGWTLDAAEQVCGSKSIEPDQILDLLLHLVDKSLVTTETQERNPRYYMLETIRQYAKEKLDEAGESTLASDRHLLYFRALAEQAKPHLISFQQLAWLDRLEAEIDNIRAALAWAQDGGAVEDGLRLATNLGTFWHYRAYLREPCRALENLLAKPLLADQIQVLVKAHNVAGALETRLGNLAAGDAHAQESERLCLQLGLISKLDLAEARNLHLVIRKFHDDLNQVRQGFEENLKLFQEGGDQWLIAQTIAYIGDALRRTGDLKGARQAHEQSLALFRECGDNICVGMQNGDLAGIAFEEGKYAEAHTRVVEELSFYRQVRYKLGIDIPLWMLGVIAIREGDYAGAKAWYSECLIFDQQMARNTQLAECLIGFAGIANAEKRFERAAQLVGGAEAEVQARDIPLENFDQAELGTLTIVLREVLGDARFEALAARGRALTQERAIAFAFEKG